MQRIGLTTQGQRSDSRAALGAPGERATSLYVHIPFCGHKCHYCDFYSIVSDPGTMEEFTKTLCQELVAQSPRAGALRTIFVGGGTPTLLTEACWGEVLETLHGNYDCSELEEFTVETNPDTASESLLCRLHEAGVNRLSIGVQSFDPSLLQFLERTHDPENVIRALEAAARAGIARRSVDLIFAIPGQTMEQWEEDLLRAAALEPEADHISCYALTYEPGTALTQRMRQGACSPASEEVELAMLEAAIDTLGQEGFARYEVSNFARDVATGRACAHNLVYWRCESCLAVGPSASGYLRDGQGGWRWTNTRSLRDWMSSVQEFGYAIVDVLEAPCPARALRERVMLGIRMAEGLDRAEIDLDATAIGCRDELFEAIERAREQGLLTANEERIQPTDAGLRVADRLASVLMSEIGL